MDVKTFQLIIVDIQESLNRRNNNGVLKKNKIDFTKPGYFNGLELTPLAYFILQATPNIDVHPEKDLREKLDRLDALRYRGAKLNRACFAQIRLQLEKEMPSYDVHDSRRRQQINRLLQHVGEPHLGLPPHMIEIGAVSPFGNHEHSSFTLEGLTLVENKKGFYASVAYCMVQNEGHVSLEPFALNPFSTWLFMLMLGGKVSPQDVLSLLSALTDSDSLRLHQSCNLALLAHFAPGFQDLNSAEKIAIIDEDRFTEIASLLKLPELEGSLLSHFGYLKCFDLPYEKRENPEIAECFHQSRILYSDDHKKLIVVWHQGHNDNELFVIRDPLAQIITLEIALGLRSAVSVRNVMYDFNPYLDDSSPAFMRYVSLPRIPGSEGFTKFPLLEVTGEEYDKALALYKKLCETYRPQYRYQQPAPKALDLKAVQLSKTKLTPQVPQRSYSTVAFAHPKPFTPFLRRTAWGALPRTGLATFMPLLTRRGQGIFRLLKALK